MLASAGVRPSKGRGQNFLVQAAVANRIVDSAALASGDQVVEIGPGLGILSERIAAHPIRHLSLIEIEPQLAVRLEQRFAGDRRVRILAADFLTAEPEVLLDYRDPVKIIGNLPFNAAAAILARLCDHSRSITRMVLMFQREVAERIRAQPGQPAYAALSVYTSLYFEIDGHFRVSAGNFHPRPKVDAEVLILTPCTKVLFEPHEEKSVLGAIRAAFSSPRKVLRNALGHALSWKASTIDAVLRDAGINPGARAENLTTADFIRLARELHRRPVGDDA